MFLSKSTSIDFIAHHEIQFQSCRGIFDVLSKVHDCRAIIGQNAKPTGADVGILMDHCAFQPNINKNNYKYLIHLSHDLADFDIYNEEKQSLSKFDLILCPGPIHHEKAVANLKNISIVEIGWSKYEIENNKMEIKKSFNSDIISIIYAPTFIDNREWVELLPSLIETGYPILIKNHLYYDFESGALPPKGSEVEYQKAIESLLEMEHFINTSNFPNVKYIDRRSNLCALFPNAQVLISDSSSANIEFLNYGLSIETGRYGIDAKETKPYNSLQTTGVKYKPLNELLALLKDKNKFQEMVKNETTSTGSKENVFVYLPPNGPSKYGASIIDLFLYLWSNDLQILPKSNKVLNLILSKLLRSL